MDRSRGERNTDKTGWANKNSGEEEGSWKKGRITKQRLNSRSTFKCDAAISFILPIYITAVKKKKDRLGYITILCRIKIPFLNSYILYSFQRKLLYLLLFSPTVSPVVKSICSPALFRGDDITNKALVSSYFAPLVWVYPQTPLKYTH